MFNGKLKNLKKQLRKLIEILMIYKTVSPNI